MSEIIDRLNGAGKIHSQSVKEKLAQTYFNHSDQPVNTFTSSPNQSFVYKKFKKNLYAKRNLLPFVILILISIFMFLILLQYSEKDDAALNAVRPRLAQPISKPVTQPLGTNLLLVDDFDQVSLINRLGGYFGTFSQTPDDLNQFCRLSFDKEHKIGFTGHSLRLDYSLESPNALNNGLWISLSNLDLTDYTGVEFFIKGDEDEGYPLSLKMQLKNANQTGTHRLDNIDSTWQRVYVPLQKFEGLNDLDHLLKMLIIFEAKQGEPKTGTVYIDNLKFIK